MEATNSDREPRHVSTETTQSENILFKMLDADKNYPIFRVFTQTLSTESVIALSRTCRHLSTLYRDLTPRYWNIDRRLKRFVNDPIAFRQVLSDSDGLISGGFALQFMDRSFWPESDLDVCVQSGEQSDAVEKYLREVEGYDLVSQLVGKYAWREVEIVCQFDKFLDNGERRQIELVLTYGHPLWSVLKTYTTALVNFITADAAYCVFPYATFITRQTFPLRIPDEFNAEVLPAKYVDRGWKVFKAWPTGEQKTPELAMGWKRIGCKRTWKASLSTAGITKSSMASFVERAEYHMRMDSSGLMPGDLKWIVIDYIERNGS